MKSSIFYPFIFAGVIAMAMSSCQKASVTAASSTTSTTSTASMSSTSTTSSVSAAVASTGSIAVSSVSAVSSSSTTVKDSIYMTGCMPPKAKRDTVAASDLLSAITTYLSTNYSGYSFVKAFKITDSLKVVNGYVVIIKYNGNFIGLKFNADGSFNKVLEQMAGADLLAPGGFHAGGPFDNRDNMQRDTIALSAIPANVKAYFTSTYPTDTLLHASITPDTTYLLISKNNGLFATNISAAAKLIKRTQLDAHITKHAAVLQANLLSAITTYLTATYPGYVFDKAFAESVNNVVQEYDVFITANSTRYAIKFTATGTFVKAIVLH